MDVSLVVRTYVQCWCECLKAKRFTGKDVTFLASSHHDLVVLAHVAGTSAAAKGVTAGNQEATYRRLSWPPQCVMGIWQ